MLINLSLLFCFVSRAVGVKLQQSYLWGMEKWVKERGPEICAQVVALAEDFLLRQQDSEQWKQQVRYVDRLFSGHWLTKDIIINIHCETGNHLGTFLSCDFLSFFN